MKAAFTCTLLAIAASTTAAAEPNAVRLNQIGFQSESAKRAVIPNASRAPLDWSLVDRNGAVEASGKTEVVGDDAASGQHLHLVDVSNIRKPASGYRLIVGDARSRPFAIDDTIYDRLKYDALAYFYHNRAGTPIEARFAGGERWARSAGHPREIATCFAGTDARGNLWPRCEYSLDVTGGWYDAGDHGKYLVNGGIALWTLLNLYERQQLNGGTASFADGQAAIPEAGNGVPDLLDEARWQMEFLLSMQVPQGKRTPVIVGQMDPAAPLEISLIDAGGMAHHKVADEKWTSLPMPPHRDPERRFLYPPSTAATLNLAATAAQCARIWRGIDPAFSARCLTAARRAFEAAKRHPNLYALDNFTGSGAYGDTGLSDEFYWAAAELFVTTGDKAYEAALRASPHFAADRAPEPFWSQVAPLGTLSLALAPDRLDETEVERLRASLVAGADTFLADSGKVGYRVPLAPPDYGWGSNGALLNRAIILAYAHDFTGEARYRRAVVDSLDYLLGRNPLDRSYVSGYGARPMENPHHRFWAHSLDPSLPPPPPGALSGGPNSTNLADEVAKMLDGRCAPQTCWVDDIDAFSLNEVAINWNAPLVWVATWVDEAR